jgi:aspartyl-tRNA(Asn)/glutamyl-tRNA(Gln) amidotransferase subunit A
VTDPYNAVITPVRPREDPPPGPLSGRALLVKDLVDVAGVRATYGSRIYADHVPGRTAPAAQRLLDAGAVLVGKANLPEFAWNVTGQNPWYGTVANPVLPGRTTGGSSSGNAAGLAAGLCDLGLGTDTGCSIRLPSACCGTVGLKTRWGTISMEGVFPLVPTLDTVGPMARTVEDVALMWSVLTGRPAPEPRLAG